MGPKPAVYFYVPKGTARLQYFWSGNPHDVRGPDGAIVGKAAGKGAIADIAVPPGMDGKVWSLTRLGTGHFWFFNVPNYLSASPDGLLVSREVAVRDGLQHDS